MVIARRRGGNRFRKESTDVWRLLSIALVVAGIVGLKLSHLD